MVREFFEENLDDYAQIFLGSVAFPNWVRAFYVSGR
jgi:hypothetical protein